MNGISSIFTVAAGGLTAASNQLATTARNIASAGINGNGPGTDDIVQVSVDLTNAKLSFKANAVVIKTADKMLGSLLDILDTDPRKR